MDSTLSTSSTPAHTTPNFICSTCAKVHAPGESEYACLVCGPSGILEPSPLAEGSRGELFTSSPGLWRYERLLAISPQAPRSPLLVGATPLAPASRLGATLGIENLYIKNDIVNPTGSLKDRASAVALARAAELGKERIAVASTGNAGSSLAGLAASVGMPAAIFVPADAPRAKLVQALIYGAQVFAVNGTYDDAFDLCVAACDHFGWYNRNTAYNPFTIEGKKTVSYEIYEQLGNHAPDAVFLPVGDGCILSGVARGFRDLRDLGLIERVPKIIAVQAEGSNAIAQAFTSGKPIATVRAQTIADSISVAIPRNGTMAVRDIRASDGTAIVVTDQEILTAQHELASLTGIFAEPSSSAALAGVHRYLEAHVVEPNETIVLLITGSGLKDIDAASKAAPALITIQPSLDALESVLRSRVGTVPSEAR